MYVIASHDKGALWKFPAMVDGGLFGGPASVGRITDYRLINRYSLSRADEAYVRRIKKSWVIVTAEAGGAAAPSHLFMAGEGFLGPGTARVTLRHFGFGSAGYKRDASLAEAGVDFQPYVASANGDLVGVVETVEPFSFDPSNFSGYAKAPIVGTFSVRYDGSLTRLLAGTPDWGEIDRRVYTRLKFSSVIEEEENPGYQVWKAYEAVESYGE